MWLAISIGIVILLYWKSLKFNYLSDDIVLRKDYLYVVPSEYPPDSFTDSIPPKRVRLWCIANHCLNVAFINILFGWKAALIFAVHPIAVNQVCWLTGNYYAGTTLLVLAMYWCITFGWIGTLPAMVFYTAALNSTITALGIPIFYLLTLNPVGMTMVFPLIMYLTGKRFRTGLAIRKGIQYGKPVPGIVPFDKIELKKFSFMTKIVSEYIGMFFLPIRMALYRTFGEHVIRNKMWYDKYCAFNRHFYLSLVTCLSLFTIGMLVNPMATIWFFALIAPHSQFKVYGQSNPCDRYLYLPMIGLCILMSYLPEPVMFAFIGFFIYRTYQYIPAWQNQYTLNKYNVEQFPERPFSHTEHAKYIMTKLIQKDESYINEAAHHFNISKKLADNDGQQVEVYINYAAFLILTMRDYKGGLDFTRQALKLAEVQGIEPKLREALRIQEKQLDEIVRRKTWD